MPAEKSGGVLLGMTGLERALSCMSCFSYMHVIWGGGGYMHVIWLAWNGHWAAWAASRVCILHVLCMYYTHTQTHTRTRTRTHTHDIICNTYTIHNLSLSLSLSLSDTHTHTHEKQQQESNACFSRPSLMRERRRAWSFEAFKPCSSSSFLNKSVLTLFTRYPVSECVCVCVCVCVRVYDKK
jgi:hypothetical protein